MACEMVYIKTVFMELYLWAIRGHFEHAFYPYFKMNILP